MEFLPDDVLVNILGRGSFPIKDILRFKLVCKSWLRVISSDPSFTSNYARKSPFTLIFRATGNYNDSNLLSYSLLEFSGNGGGEHTHHNSIMTPKISDHPGSDSRLSFIGSCDCSAFILHHKRLDDHAVYRVYSFNPILGSCVKVADDIIGKWERREYKVGFIPSNSTYKLVRFVPGGEKAENPEIFTVGGLDENWRKVDDDPLLFCSGARLICFNGAYHWVSTKNDDMICTFDLLEEKCGVGIPKPYGVTRLSIDTRVTILDHRLSVVDISYEPYSAAMVIWKMKEYGVVDSWSKFITLRLKDEDPGRWRFNQDLVKSGYRDKVPIVELTNGDILFAEKSSKGMCFYNFEEKRWRQINEPLDSSPLYRRYENTYIPRFGTFDS